MSTDLLLVGVDVVVYAAELVVHLFRLITLNS
ncbi:hypothetical protein JOJ87_003413 [Rhodococcus ruber]|nr:hypothetical protein [Rhodococcus ruber]